jgi:hypothetical protein
MTSPNGQEEWEIRPNPGMPGSYEARQRGHGGYGNYWEIEPSPMGSEHGYEARYVPDLALEAKLQHNRGANTRPSPVSDILGAFVIAWLYTFLPVGVLVLWPMGLKTANWLAGLLAVLSCGAVGAVTFLTLRWLSRLGKGGENLLAQGLTIFVLSALTLVLIGFASANGASF